MPVSTWNRIRAALRREKRDVEEAIDELTERGNATLDQKERELRATPEEKLALEQERGRAIDAELDAIRRRVQDDHPQAD